MLSRPMWNMQFVRKERRGGGPSATTSHLIQRQARRLPGGALPQPCTTKEIGVRVVTIRTLLPIKGDARVITQQSRRSTYFFNAFTAAITFLAPSSRSSPRMHLMSEFFISSMAPSTLFPCRRTTSGTLGEPPAHSRHHFHHHLTII